MTAMQPATALIPAALSVEENMTNLVETEVWEAGIYQFETEDPVLGGEDGIDNVPTRQLANRTAWLKAELLLRAALASPEFTGIPKVPTAALGTNTTQAASTAYVISAITALIDSSPGALDTLNELAAALGDDPNFATTITNALALKAPLANAVLTGDPKAPTPALGDNDTSIATTAFVQAAIASMNNSAIKTPARAGAPGNINVAAPGAAIDGVAMVANDRVLLLNQTLPAQNGIYTWNGAAVPMTRTTDADGTGELIPGTVIVVTEGTTFADSEWEISTDGAITIGTTGLAFKRIDQTAQPVTVPVRQTVLKAAAAPLQIGAGLAVNLLATATPYIVAIPAGMGANGQIDFIARIIADVVGFWTGIGASQTSYLYVDRNISTGAITGVVTNQAPVCQLSTVAPSTANAVHTYMTDTGDMYVGNGATASVVQRTLVGECVAGASTITSVTPYAPLGQNIITSSTLVSGTVQNFNHRIGGSIQPIVDYALKCTTATAGYSVGDEVPRWLDGYTSVADTGIGVYSDSKNVGVMPYGGNIAINTKSTGVVVAVTFSQFSLIMKIQRPY